MLYLYIIIEKVHLIQMFFKGVDVETYKTDKSYLTNEDFYALKQEVKNMAIDKEAFKEIYLMNIDPASLEREGFWSTLGETVTESFLGEEAGDVVQGRDKSDIADAIQKLGGNLGIDPESGFTRGIPFTDEQKELFEQTSAEITAETLGHVPKIVVDFAILNAMAGGILNITKGAKYLNMLRTGKIWDKTRRRYVNYNATVAAAAKEGYKGTESFAKYLKLNKLVQHGGDWWTKTQALAWTAFIEEGKLQIGMDMPAGGGTAFAVIGHKFNKLSQVAGLTLKGKAAPWNSALKVGRSAISFVPAAEGALNLEAVIDDMMGNKSWKKHLEENYPDLSTAAQRWYTNLITGSGLGMAKMNWVDFHITNQSKLSLARESRVIYEAELKKPKDQQDQGKIAKYANIEAEAMRQYQFHLKVFSETTPELSKARGEKEAKKNAPNHNIVFSIRWYW